MDGKPVTWSAEPRQVPEGATVLEMNGKVYHRAKSIAIARWPYMERYKATWLHGRQVHEFHKVLGDLEKSLNKTAFVDCAVMVHNLKNDVAGITDPTRLPAAACLTMLFWNYEGEDVGTMSDELMDGKVKDAMASGIDQSFFFSQALASLLAYSAHSSQTHQQHDGSQKEVEKQMTNPVT